MDQTSKSVVRALSALIAAGLFAASLVGCGQKGPLTLPSSATPASAPSK